MTGERHLTDDELVLRYYGEAERHDDSDAAPFDASLPERPQGGVGPAGDGLVDGHLASCAECRAAWQRLSAEMALTRFAHVPEPDSEFEARVWASLARQKPWAERPRWSLHQFLPLGAWAAAVAALVTMSSVDLARRRPPVEVPAVERTAEGSGSPVRERVLLTALDSHFAQTEMLLVELMNAPDTQPSSFDFERATADDLVQSSRLYRVTAGENGDARVADVLDDVQTVLMEVARGPVAPEQVELAAIRARIEDDGLLFKVRAVTNDIRDRQQRQVISSEGSL